MEFTIKLSAEEVEQVATHLHNYYGYWGDRQLDAQSMVMRKVLKEFDSNVEKCHYCSDPLLENTGEYVVIELDGLVDCCEECWHEQL